MDRLTMLIRLALRSMLSHRIKNLIVSVIMVLGTFLVVVGTSILDSIERSMQESITASATGHIQVFSQDADDDLAIFGQMGAALDIGEIDNYAQVETELRALDGVKAVVPMALGNAVSFGKSELERVLEDLRLVVQTDGLAVTERQEQVRQIVTMMLKQNANAAEISTAKARLAEERRILTRVASDEFWRDFAADPEGQLDYLDTRLAPLSTEGKLIYVRYIATDPTLFAKSFQRFQIVEGTGIPEGKRGVVLAKRFYERQVKSRVAREFDAIVEDLDESSIADDEVLRNKVQRMARLVASVVYQLDSKERPQLLRHLAELMPEVKGSIEERMTAFLNVDDTNAKERHEFFYEQIAPLIDVYDIAVGDEIVLQAFTKSGYAKSVKVKVWGTFNFRGLETSDLAGGISVMDLMTFRTLYGKMTEEQRRELEEIRQQVGVAELNSDNVEAALFGEGEPIEEVQEEKSNARQDDTLVVDAQSGPRTQSDAYDPKELTRGVILNAAVILDDSEAVESTLEAIAEVNEKKELGIKGIDWQEASGLVGQFILVISLVLYTAIVIIFTVALVIINNSMVMATMERIPEIGTMRAIGAQRSTIVLMTLLETTVLCLLSGLVGAVLGAGMISLLGHTGIAAPNDVMVFLFGGPQLYPTFGASNLIIGVVIILVVSVLSTIYPALLAIGVQPAVAMRGKE